MGKTGHDGLITCILTAMQNKVCRILLYGSDPEETAVRKTEYDVAVLTPYKISEDEEARLSDAVFEWNHKHKARYSVIDVDYDTFMKRREEIPFYQNIDQKGTVLWEHPDLK